MTNAYQPTYDSLLAEVQDITENTNPEFVGNISLFIQRAQDTVSRDLGLGTFDVFAYASCPTTGFIVRDDSWLVVKSLQFVAAPPPVSTEPEGDFLIERHLDYVYQYRRAAAVAAPRYWTEEGTDVITVGPKPTGTKTVRIVATVRLTPLGPLHQTNWLTKNVGDLLLLMALTNAESYLVNPERTQEFMGMYRQSLPAVVNELRDSESRRFDPIRSAPHPMPAPSGG